MDRGLVRRSNITLESPEIQGGAEAASRSSQIANTGPRPVTSTVRPGCDCSPPGRYEISTSENRPNALIEEPSPDTEMASHSRRESVCLLRSIKRRRTHTATYTAVQRCLMR
jgi:hypothetical protein